MTAIKVCESVSFNVNHQYLKIASSFVLSHIHKIVYYASFVILLFVCISKMKYL